MKKLLALFFVLALTALTGCKAEPDTKTAIDYEDVTEISTVSNFTEAPTEKVPAIVPKDHELVRITDYIPDAQIDLKYATEDNFTGVVIYSPETEALLRYGTVKKLMSAQQALSEKGYNLLIWDAYRPAEAQFRLWEVCPDPRFVANPNNGFSNHSRGNTVDVSIVKKDGSHVLMPSEFDDFSSRADRTYSDISPEVRNNALMLESIMTECGFEGYSAEWWHYSDTTEYPVIK